MSLPNIFGFASNSSNSTNNNMNDEKHHYFIANIIDDIRIFQKLQKLRKKLINKYKLEHYHYPNIITGNLLYIGYFDQKVAQIFMKDIMSYLLNSISKKFGKLYCKFNGIKTHFDGSYFKIYLDIEDNEKSLQQIILPYLFEKGIKPVFKNRNQNKKAYVNLIYTKGKPEKIVNLQDKFKDKFQIKIDYPFDTFTIDKLCLLKGTPSKSRSGAPSTHDQMDFEKVADYEFDFKGSTQVNMNQSMNSNLNNVNKMNNTNTRNNLNNKNNLKNKNSNRRNNLNNNRSNNKKNNNIINENSISEFEVNNQPLNVNSLNNLSNSLPHQNNN